MVNKNRAFVEEFFEMLSASMQNLDSMKGILRFGQYAWEKPYNSIDIVTVIGGNYFTEDEMVEKSKTDINRYEKVLAAGIEQLHLPQITNHHYFGFLRGDSLVRYDYESNQLEEQVKGFYDDQMMQQDVDENFMFNPTKSLWLKENSFTKWIGQAIDERIEAINTAYQKKLVFETSINAADQYKKANGDQNFFIKRILPEHS